MQRKHVHAHIHADQRLAEAEAALAKARGRLEMARALATFPADAGDGDIVDLTEPYNAALHDTPSPTVPTIAHVHQPDKCGLFSSRQIALRYGSQRRRWFVIHACRAGTCLTEA